MNPCKGICTRYKATKPLGSRYEEGQKRCQECEIFLWWDGVFCPCCGCKLRTKLRNRAQQERMKQKRSAQQLSLLTIKLNQRS